VLEILIGALILSLFLMFAGVMEALGNIRKTIEKNYQQSLARAMSTTDIVVEPPPPPKVESPCVCGHAKADHRKWPEHPGASCRHSGCTCTGYRPMRGLWPGEVKI